MKIIISNTTEVGITFVKDDIWQSPPVSFPGKLLSFLFERYKAFNGSDESGMVIVPTELIPENGKKLEAIVLELAHLNGLEEGFMDWLENSNYFCNSLVDRIVPGAPSAADKASIEAQLHYQDDLLILAEVYRLWAIESSSPKVNEVLSFSQADSGVAIEPDITKFRELKLRLLNGAHTMSCALAVLANFQTVKEAMNDEGITTYMNNLMMKNIVPAITGDIITVEEARQFAEKVLDRFRNPFIEHKWISISAQYSSKIKLRILPVVSAFYEKYGSVPEYIALGFAAFLLFMRSERQEDGSFKGRSGNRDYTITDDRAAYFNGLWATQDLQMLVKKALQDESVWGADLCEMKGFCDAVYHQLNALIQDGAQNTIKNMLTDKTVVTS